MIDARLQSNFDLPSLLSCNISVDGEVNVKHFNRILNRFTFDEDGHFRVITLS